MGLLDRLMGRREEPPPVAPASSGSPDEQAIERYRYLLRTAPPDRLEEAHAEAFEQLTPEQRQQVLRALQEETPPGERSESDDPRSLARMATRAEVRKPGTLERSLGRPGMGMGGVFAGSMLGTVAGVFIGTAIAGQLFDDGGGEDSAGEGGDSGGGADGGESMAGGGDEARYGDGGDSGGGDSGGSDFGGGDFGGGDFGGF